MRYLRLILVCFISVSLLAGCKERPSADAVPASPTPAITGGAIYWPGGYWVDIAAAKGMYKEAGLDVTIINTDADYFASYDMLLKGELDFIIVTFFDFVKMTSEGKELVGVLVTDYSHGAESLVAKPGINSIQDLKGKRVGLPQKTYMEYIFTMAAQRDELALSDFQIVDTPVEGIEHPYAEGKLDAVFAWEPNLSASLEMVPGSTKLFSTSEIPGIAGGILAFRKQFTKEHPTAVHKILQVWDRANKYLRDNPDEATAIIAKIYERPEQEVKDFMESDRILNIRDSERAFSFASGFDSVHGAFRQMNDFMLEHGIAETPLDTTTVVDATFVRHLQKQQEQ